MEITGCNPDYTEKDLADCQQNWFYKNYLKDGHGVRKWPSCIVRWYYSDTIT